jgi:hypothetical protein
VKLIKNWKIEDKLFYDETAGFRAALKMFQSKNYLTIIGGPGSGKTATSRHGILLQIGMSTANAPNTSSNTNTCL